MSNYDLYRVKKDDPFLIQYQSSELRIASEFLTTWLPFLCRDLCHNCSKTLSDRIHSLDPGLDGGGRECESLDERTVSTIEKNVDSGNINDNSDTNSLGSWKDAAETTSLGSWKDGMNGISEPDKEASDSSGLAHGSLSVATPSPHMSWADMAQEDEFEEMEEEEQHEAYKQCDDNDYALKGESSGLEVVEKSMLSREEREHMRFMHVRRKKDFMCLEKIKGKIVNILAGLELHAGVFSAAEQKRIVDFVYLFNEMGKKGVLKERTYSAPQKWMRGKGRITLQFGCCYNYATDKNGNPPGILKKESVDPIPGLFKVMIRRLVKCECNIVFGSNLKIVGAGDFAGPIAIPLPMGSVLVLNGHGADVPKHCVPAVPTKRISITFRKMDESQRPFEFVPEPDLQGIQPLPYNLDKPETSKSDSQLMKQRVRRDSNMDGREHGGRSNDRSQPHYSVQYRRRPIDKQMVR